MLRTCCLVAVLYVAAPRAQAQSTPPTFELGTTTENPILGPNFGGSGNTQCDASENAYFDLTKFGPSEKYILRISADGKDDKRLPLPSDLAKQFLSAFYVDSLGTLYELFVSADPSSTYTLVEISSSGNETRRTALQLPQISPMQLAVLPNGKTMVRGTLFLPVEPAPKGKDPVIRGFLYMAWLDTNGQLVHDTGTSPKGQDVFDLSTHSDFAAITPGPPGTFLTVFGTSLNTYDSSGTLLHSNPIAKPDKEAVAASIQYLDGQAEILFQVPHQEDVFPPTPEDAPHPLTPDPNTRKPQKVTVFRQVWLFANPEDGTMHGFYEFPGFSGSGECYLGNQNFLYTTVKSMQPIFVQAHPR